ncbi:MAG TPA: phosphopantetheine-binding protein, partial [Bacillota bacterium]|nr:phosphopantetheine-binding protein [Bacillota bacterium]
DKSGNKYLGAYIVWNEKRNIAGLREDLAKELPNYMLPSYFIELEKLPLNPNGKIDRKALPEPDGNITTGVEYEAPRNEIETKLVAIWRKVLGIEQVGINDNFFMLGGYSLKAITLTNQIDVEFGIQIKLDEIFINPTIKGEAEVIGRRKQEIATLDAILKKMENSLKA